MPSANLTSKGRVTVPKVIREQLKIKTGDRLDFVSEGDRIVLRPRTLDLRSLRGILHQPGRTAIPLEKMETAIARLHGPRDTSLP